MNWIVTGMESPANQYVTNPTLILTKHPPRYNRDSGSHFLVHNHPRSFGFLLGTIHRKIERRPDILEAVIFDGEARQLKGQQLVGFCVSEIQARV